MSMMNNEKIINEIIEKISDISFKAITEDKLNGNSKMYQINQLAHKLKKIIK